MQILGSTDLGVDQALASGALAYAYEPESGTMLQAGGFAQMEIMGAKKTKQKKRKRILEDARSLLRDFLFLRARARALQWMEVQTKIRNMLGRTWTERALEACVLNLFHRDNLTGHREAESGDPRYAALLNHARKHLPDNSEIKVGTRARKR